MEISSTNTKTKSLMTTTVQLETELEERIQREVIRRGARYGTKRIVIMEALEKGLDAIERETQEAQLAAAS